MDPGHLSGYREVWYAERIARQMNHYPNVPSCNLQVIEVLSLNSHHLLCLQKLEPLGRQLVAAFRPRVY